MHSKEKAADVQDDPWNQQVVTERQVDPVESRCGISLRVRDQAVSAPGTDDSD